MSDIIKAGVLPVAIEFMDRPCIRATEDFAHAGYPDCEALLIVEVEGSDAEIDEQLGLIKQIAHRHEPGRAARKPVGGRKQENLAGPQIGLRRDGPDCRLHVPGRHDPGVEPAACAAPHRRDVGECGLDVANVFHAGDGNMHPLILYDANKPGDLELCEAFGAEILKLCVEVGGCLTGEHGVGIEKRDLMNVQFAPEDLDAQMAVKDVFDPAGC